MSAGIVPLFTSAPRIKLTVNGKHIAYAIGFNINIAVDVQPIQVLGRFEAASLEPTLYNVVTGTMQIVKLISKTAGDENRNAAAQRPSRFSGGPSFSVTEEGGKEVVNANSNANFIADSNSILGAQGLALHLDPARVLISRAFDLELYLKIPSAEDLAKSTNLSTGAAQTISSTPTDDTEVWLKIQSCRLTSRNVNISHGQLVNEPVNFQGLLVTTSDSDEKFGLDSSLKDKL